jgi:hypothetical protein
LFRVERTPSRRAVIKLFFVGKKGSTEEIDMSMDGDDAGRCSNGLTARKFRDATAEERAAYRRWLRGIIFFYCGLLFIAGVAVVNYSGTGRTELTKLSVNQAARSN